MRVRTSISYGGRREIVAVRGSRATGSYRLIKMRPTENGHETFLASAKSYRFRHEAEKIARNERRGFGFVEWVPYPTKPKKRKFQVTISFEVELSQKLLDAVLTDEWRQAFYHYTSPEEIAEHVGRNLYRDVGLAVQDGFADQPEDAAVIDDKTEVVEAEEIKT